MSFAITVRPKNGLHKEYDTAVIKWIKKQKYGAYVHEMEDEARHLHAQIWIDETRQKDRNDIRKALFRIAEKYDPDWSGASKKVLSQGVKYAYNDDFVDKYCTKENEIEYMKMPLDTSIYYPTPEEQEEIKRKATRVADAYFDHLKREWEEQNPEYEYNYIETPYHVGKFYYDLMFKEKKIAVVRDDRSRKQNAKCLLHYLFPHSQSIMDMILTKEDSEKYLMLKAEEKTI